MASTIVLISGANRGLGKGLLQRYLAQPDHTVIAANRDPEHASSKELDNLPKAAGSRLIVVKVEATSDSDALEAVKKLQDQGIDHLDIVIANSGIVDGLATVADVSIEQLQRHVDVNFYGGIRLFQATIPLLRKAANPKFVTMGTAAASLKNQVNIPNALYGPTKAAGHWIAVRINNEEEKVNSFVIHPGFVQTDMGNRSAQALGLEKAFVTVDDSCDGIFKLISESTKEATGGRFWNYDGEELPW
ncbi:NAD(P)-binding protein [Durotheca rogersii]|uniref:NAD(P)-binding protein n=1 Tax=Durotheca rogersii TaxID=419775 RepID=UPI00222059C0|nr:NAD(P)-binding protein [Durotheca rogersii]KAI5861162.1 NAD(P)-binding protein [Durotheca rogersii]